MWTFGDVLRLPRSHCSKKISVVSAPEATFNLKPPNQNHHQTQVCLIHLKPTADPNLKKSMKLTRLPNSKLTLALIGAVALAGLSTTSAQTWTGGTTLWGTDTNWNPVGVPASGADLAFGGTATNFTVDLGAVNRDVRSMTFTNSSGTDYTFQNGTLRSTTRNIDFLINNGSDDVIINSALTFTGDNNARRINGTGTGDFIINGAISADIGFSNASGAGLVDLFINGSNTTWTGSQARLTTNANNNITLGNVNALGSAQLAMSGNHNINATVNIVSNGSLSVSGGSAATNVSFKGSNYSFASGTMNETGLKLAPQGNTVTVRGLFASADEIVVNGSATGKVVFDGNVETLTQASRIEGFIRVEGGTLLINGIHTVTKAATDTNYTVNSGATLGGNGTLRGGGLATITGTLAPGSDSIGTLTFGTNASTTSTTDVQFNLDSVFAMELASAGSSDLLAIAGGLTLGTGVTLDLTQLSGTLSGNYTLATFSSLVGTFDTVNYNGGSVNPNLINGTHELVYGSNSIMLNVIPEPSSALLIGLGAFGLLARRRRRSI